MKFLVFFFLCCVALAAAAPSVITAWPGLIAPALGPRTIVAGPTVVNNVDPLGVGSHIVSPGIIGVI